MEPWENQALTRYSCEDFLARTTPSCLLLRKEEIRPNIWPDISQDVGLWRRPTRQALFKRFGCIIGYSSSSPWLVKSPNNSIWYNCQETALDCRNQKKYWKTYLKTYWNQNHIGNQKKGHISLGDQQSYYLQVFQRLYQPQKEN